MIRGLEEETGRPIGILVDLQGPKLRLGVFAERRRWISARATFSPSTAIRRRATGARPTAPSGNLELARARPSHSDRRRQSDAARRRGGAGTSVDESSRSAGRVSDRKGVSLPDTTIPTSAMTEKDRVDLHAALEEDIDWIALSFVQRPEDMDEVKAIVNGRALVMAKIEKPQAVAADRRDHGGRRRPDGGARRSWRGDAARTGARHPEDADPACAPARQAGGRGDADAGIDDHFAGADARGGVGRRDRGVRGRGRHHAVGRERVRPISARGGGDDESDRGGGGSRRSIYPSIIEAQRAAPEATGADAIAEATRDVAETLDFKVICAWTSSGSTGLRIARERPRSSILALTPIE